MSGEVQSGLKQASSAPLVRSGVLLRKEVDRTATHSYEGLQPSKVRVKDIGGSSLVIVGLHVRGSCRAPESLRVLVISVVELDTGPGHGVLLEAEEKARGVGGSLDILRVVAGERLGEGTGRVYTDVDVVELIELCVGS